LAHEVGNPLGAIIGYADVARARAAKENRDPELLDSIREECSRIDRIVRGLLDYARPKGREVLLLPPRDVLEKVRDLLERQGRWGDVEHRWDVDDELPEYTRVDATRLEQVMVNLLLNALHALRDTPTPKVVISVTSEVGESGRLPARRGGDPPEINYLHRRRVGADSPSGGVDLLHTAGTVLVISVADNGPGFPPEEVRRVFDPFYTTKDVGEGIGLGLAICARLIEGMGGEIQAEDSPEGGALFTLRLPADGAMLSDELGEDPQ
jgi:signal transduction histidine kinase